jgi:hypothetical protein
MFGLGDAASDFSAMVAQSLARSASAAATVNPVGAASLASQATLFGQQAAALSAPSQGSQPVSNIMQLDQSQFLISTPAGLMDTRTGQVVTDRVSPPGTDGNAAAFDFAKSIFGSLANAGASIGSALIAADTAKTLSKRSDTYAPGLFGAPPPPVQVSSGPSLTTLLLGGAALGGLYYLVFRKGRRR